MAKRALLPLPAALLALALSVAPPRVTGGEPLVDPVEVARGIELRLGEDAEGWTIEIQGTDPARTDVWLIPPQGSGFGRDLSLQGSTEQERNRELASALVLVMEEHRRVEVQDDPPPPPPDATQADGPRGWVAGFGRAGVSPTSSPDLDLGAELAGGVWLLSEIVQPTFELGWSRSWAGTLKVDGIRFGPGLAAGAPVADGLLWVGALASARALWGRARDEGRAAQWSSSLFAGPLLQVRWRWLFVSGRVGVEATLPGLRFLGEDDTLRWGGARLSFSLGIGAVLGSD